MLLMLTLLQANMAIQESRYEAAMKDLNKAQAELDEKQRELDKQPERQRTVVTMRDILGFESAEVVATLGISIANQRVLLHRGRSAIRQALEDYLKEGSS